MPHAVTLVSDFNVEPLARFLRNMPGWQDADVDVAPFGQVYQHLAEVPDSVKRTKIIWTAPERVIASFARALSLEAVDHTGVLAEVDVFADAILKLAGVQRALVASWVLPRNLPGYGMLDWQPGLGLRHLLAQMNLRLAERLSGQGSVHLLNAERWLRAEADSGVSKLWYAAKIPFAMKAYELAAHDIAGIFDALAGKSRRLVVIDLDNTLWGGVVGETGWHGVRLGGHDHVGEAYKDFQRELKYLSNRGIQLAIVSKNDERVALQTIDEHPEMLLRRPDFAGWRINWNDKAANIVDLADELNLGLASLVFIDDSPAERDRVASALPDVLVPSWPADPTSYVNALRELACFHAAAISGEDRMRAQSYAANRERQDHLKLADSREEWLRRLGTRVRVDPVAASNIARVAQLFNKTNQLNLSTRRLTEEEILEWKSASGRSMMAISVADQFGDMGLVGIVSVEVKNNEGQVVDYILSCRVMGRKVEETLLHLAAEELRRLGAKSMDIHYLPTERNRPTLEVLEKSGLWQPSPSHFIVDLAEGFTKPPSVKVEQVDG